MAHKHNRRRVRPRIRYNRNNYYTNNMTYDTLSLPPISATPHPTCTRFLTGKGQGDIPQALDGLGRWYEQQALAAYTRTQTSPKYAISDESERLKVFGGEAGDLEKQDIGLCLKMAEVFEGMDWINT